MADDREIRLEPRRENTREQNPIQVKNFDLSEIDKHFVENLDSLKLHFRLADELVSAGKDEEAKDIWRTQVVFLESALDYYVHEITKYGMNKIFNNEWSMTEQFKNCNLKLIDVLDALKNPEDTKWFIKHINDFYSAKTFMNFQTMKDQLKLLGIKIQCVADKAFHVQGSTDGTMDQLKRNLNRIYDRRNDIVHQSDRNHQNAQRNDIAKEEVERDIVIIEKIVTAISICISDDSCRVSNNAGVETNIDASSED